MYGSENISDTSDRCESILTNSINEVLSNNITTGKEYLSYKAEDSGAIARVLLEEIGHWVDSQIN